MTGGYYDKKIKSTDCEEVRKICIEEPGYECEISLIVARINELDESREAVFVAETDNKIVGFVHVEKYKLLYCEDMANILGLAVVEDYQRCGFGKELLNETEQWARNNGIKILRLNSGMKRTAAHKFYRVMDFNDEKDQKRFIKRL